VSFIGSAKDAAHMTANDAAQAGLLQAIADEAERLEEDAKYSHAGHSEEACSSDSWHYWLGVPTVLLSAAASVTAFSSAGAGAGIRIDPHS
jgi:hypothetical protein